MTNERTARRQLWEERVRRWKDSGQSLNGWCRANGVALSTMHKWVKTIESEVSATAQDPVEAKVAPVTTEEMCQESSPAFVLLPPEPPVEDVKSLQVVVHQGRVSIEVTTGYSPKLLASVIETLLPIC